MPTRARCLPLLAALACTPRPQPTAPPDPPPTVEPEPAPSAPEPPAPKDSATPDTATVAPEPPAPEDSSTPTPPTETVTLAPEPPAPKDSHGRIPVIRDVPVTVGPSWSSAAIRRVIRRADFSRCGAPRPSPAAYSFTIARDGSVLAADATDAGGQPIDDPAHRCALEVLRALKFPAGVGTLHVRYPLR